MRVLTAGHLEVSPLDLTKKSKGIPDEPLSGHRGVTSTWLTLLTS